LIIGFSIIPNYHECGIIFEQLFDRVYHHAYSEGLKNVGCGISIYHDTKLRDRDIPVEAAAIFEAIPSNEQVWIYQLPGVETMASVIHQGSFNSLGQAYNALLKWIEINNYQIVGSTREVYLKFICNKNEKATLMNI
jgi:effector-binding domain-containing protein